jgi:hypothetical protein
MGEDRLVLTLQALETAARTRRRTPLLRRSAGEGHQPGRLALARELRRAGLRIELGDGSFRLKKSFEAADKTARASSSWAKTSSIRYPDSEDLLHRHTNQGSSRGAGGSFSANETSPRQAKQE